MSFLGQVAGEWSGWAKQGGSWWSSSCCWPLPRLWGGDSSPWAAEAPSRSQEREILKAHNMSALILEVLVGLRWPWRSRQGPHKPIKHLLQCLMSVPLQGPGFRSWRRASSGSLTVPEPFLKPKALQPSYYHTRRQRKGRKNILIFEFCMWSLLVLFCFYCFCCFVLFSFSKKKSS